MPETAHYTNLVFGIHSAKVASLFGRAAEFGIETQLLGRGQPQAGATKPR